MIEESNETNRKKYWWNQQQFVWQFLIFPTTKSNWNLFEIQQIETLNFKNNWRSSVWFFDLEIQMIDVLVYMSFVIEWRKTVIWYFVVEDIARNYFWWIWNSQNNTVQHHSFWFTFICIFIEIKMKIMEFVLIMEILLTKSVLCFVTMKDCNYQFIHW